MRASSPSLSLRSCAFAGTMALACAWAAPAAAQSASASPSKYPACAGTPSKSDSEAAHGAYLAGKGPFDEADYATAINYFKDAYRRDCTKYELLNIIARAYELKGDRAEAVAAAETYVQRAPADDPANESIQRRIVNLKAQIAAQPPQPAEPEPTASASAPAPPDASEPRGDEGAGGERGHTVYPWILTGVGGAALVTGIVLAAVGEGQRSRSIQNARAADCERVGGSIDCSKNPNAPIGEFQAENDAGTTKLNVGIGLMVGGAAVAAGGLIWHFLEPTGSRTAKWLPTPQLGSGYAGLSMSGGF